MSYLKIVRASCFWAAFIILTSLTGAPLLAQDVGAGREEVAKISDLVEAHRFSEAVYTADAALKIHPKDCSVLSLKGIAQNSLNQPRFADASFRRALSFCPSYVPALEGVAEVEYALKDPDAAKFLERLLEVQPDDPTSHAMLATIDRSKGNCADALTHFEASKPLFGAHPDLQLGYVSCLAATGNYSDAVTEYQSVDALRDGDQERYNLAFLQWKANDPAAALKTLDPILNDQGDGSVPKLAAQIVEQMGDISAARKLLQRAIALRTDDENSYTELAEMAFSDNSFAATISVLNAGLAKLPRSAELHLLRGVMEVQVSQIEQAVNDFKCAHDLDPNLSFVSDAMGILKNQQHQGPEALRFFREQVRVHPGDALLQYLYAEALSGSAETSGDTAYQDAIIAAKRSVNIDPKYLPARDLLAILYLRTQHPAAALEQTRLALVQNSNDEAALFQEIKAERELGDKADLAPLVKRLAQLKEKDKLHTAERYQLHLQEK